MNKDKEMISLNVHHREEGLITSCKDQNHHSKHKLESKKKDKMEKQKLHQTLETLSNEIVSLMERASTMNSIPPTPPLGIDFEEEIEKEVE